MSEMMNGCPLFLQFYKENTLYDTFCLLLCGILTITIFFIMTGDTKWTSDAVIQLRLLMKVSI